MTERLCRCGNPPRKGSRYQCLECHRLWMKLNRDRHDPQRTQKHSRREVVKNLREIASELTAQGRSGAAEICTTAIAYLS